MHTDSPLLNLPTLAAIATHGSFSKAADALDLGAKVCPFCCGGWVVVVSYKFDAFLGVIFCSPKFDGSVPVFGLHA